MGWAGEPDELGGAEDVRETRGGATVLSRSSPLLQEVFLLPRPSYACCVPARPPSLSPRPRRPRPSSQIPRPLAQATRGVQRRRDDLRLAQTADRRAPGWAKGARPISHPRSPGTAPSPGACEPHWRRRRLFPRLTNRKSRRRRGTKGKGCRRSGRRRVELRGRWVLKSSGRPEVREGKSRRCEDSGSTAEPRE